MLWRVEWVESLFRLASCLLIKTDAKAETACKKQFLILPFLQITIVMYKTCHHVDYSCLFFKDALKYAYIGVCEDFNLLPYNSILSHYHDKILE